MKITHEVGTPEGLRLENIELMLITLPGGREFEIQLAISDGSPPFLLLQFIC